MNTLAEALIIQTHAHLAQGRLCVAVIGVSPEAFEVVRAVQEFGGSAEIFDPRERQGAWPQLRPWGELAASEPELVVIAVDEEKELLLRAAADALDDRHPLPRVVLGGLGHQVVAEELFEKLEAPALVSSYATGHPNTRHHLYDCLRSAAAHGRCGAVVELGSVVLSPERKVDLAWRIAATSAGLLLSLAAENEDELSEWRAEIEAMG
jgi:hypothetical protein